jgi:hypothetical protein
MALLRILNQLQQVNQKLGKVSRLEDAVLSADYPLPESELIKHPYSQLFTIQRVHDDIGWALDCRVRYGLNLAESIPRPEHRMDETFVVSYKLNEPQSPSFFVQTWQKESGAWKLVSFDIKHKSFAPPTGLLSGATPAGATPADSKLQATVEKFLTTWLIDRRIESAADMFLPESYRCDGLAEHTTKPAPANGNANVRRFLEAIATQSSKENTLERTLSAAQEGHSDLKPLLHAHEGSYLMADASAELMRMYACEASPPAAVATMTTAAQAGGVLTAFHLSRSKQQSAGVVSLYWKNVKGDWRIASFTVSAD